MEDKKFQPPPYYKFKVFCKLAWEHCNNNDDFILFMNGGRGTGKSLGGLAVLREYLEENLFVSFNKRCLREHTVYTHEQLFNRAKYLPDKHPILVDEGVRVAYTGDFATREVKEMVKFFTQCRTKNRLVIFISPEFTDISKRLRNYAKYRIRMIQRKQGVLFSRDNSECQDPFHLNELKDLEKFHDVSTDMNSVISKLQRHPCYKDQILFPTVPKEIQEWYDEYRDESVFGQAQDHDFIGRNDRSFIVLHNIAQKWDELKALKKLTQGQLRELLCVNPVTNKCFWTNDTPLSLGLKRLRAKIEKQNTKEVEERDLVENS